MAMQGVRTELSSMNQTANRAVEAAERLHAAVQKLTATNHAELSTWKGDAVSPFWTGHEEHVQRTGRLVQSLHNHSQSLTKGANHYDTTDQDNTAAQARVNGAGSGIALSTLL